MLSTCLIQRASSYLTWKRERYGSVVIEIIHSSNAISHMAKIAAVKKLLETETYVIPCIFGRTMQRMPDELRWEWIFYRIKLDVARGRGDVWLIWLSCHFICWTNWILCRGVGQRNRCYRMHMSTGTVVAGVCESFVSVWLTTVSPDGNVLQCVTTRSGVTSCTVSNSSSTSSASTDCVFW